MTTINTRINYDKCHLEVKCQNMEYNFTFSLDRFNLQRVQEIVQKFRSLARSVAESNENDECQEPSSVVLISHTSDYNHVFSLIEHLCEDDYSLGYLRFEQRIDMAEYVNFSETNFFIEITEENRELIASDLQRVSNEIESYMRRESRHLQFGSVQGMSPSMYRSPAPSAPVTPSAPMASRQMPMSPPSMTPQQLFGSPQGYQTPTASSLQQPSAPLFNRYSQQRSSQSMSPVALFRDN